MMVVIKCLLLSLGILLPLASCTPRGVVQFDQLPWFHKLSRSNRVAPKNAEVVEIVIEAEIREIIRRPTVNKPVPTGQCIKNCEDVDDGDYQSCKGE